MKKDNVLLLLSNNRLLDPFLESQLINIYKDCKFFNTKKLYAGLGNAEPNIFQEFELLDNFIGINPIIRFLKLYLSLISELKKGKNSKILVHLRGGPMSILFFLIPSYLKNNVEYIYDPRGLFITAKKEQFTKFSYLFNLLRPIEKRILINAKFVILESLGLSSILKKEYGNVFKELICYNACSFGIRNRNSQDIFNRKIIKVVYCGTVNHWHDINEIKRVFLYINSLLNENGFIVENNIFSQKRNHEFIKEKFKDTDLNLKVDFIPYTLLEKKIEEMDIGISVVLPTKSTKITSPIKISDYIYKDLIIVSNSGIGDFDEFYRENNSVILFEFDSKLDFSLAKLMNVNFEANRALRKDFSIEKNRLLILNSIKPS